MLSTHTWRIESLAEDLLHLLLWCSPDVFTNLLLHHIACSVLTAFTSLIHLSFNVQHVVTSAHISFLAIISSLPNLCIGFSPPLKKRLWLLNVKTSVSKNLQECHKCLWTNLQRWKGKIRLPIFAYIGIGCLCLPASEPPSPPKRPILKKTSVIVIYALVHLFFQFPLCSIRRPRLRIWYPLSSLQFLLLDFICFTFIVTVCILHFQSQMELQLRT